jgi:hypothetical protein
VRWLTRRRAAGGEDGTSDPRRRVPVVAVTKATMTATMAAKPPGRPKGTGYARQDAPPHEQMREMLECGQVNSRTAAAKQLAGQAYGSGCQDSKVRRLVKSFPY